MRITCNLYDGLPEQAVMQKNKNLLDLLSFAHCQNKVDVLWHASIIAGELMQNWKIVTPTGARRFLGLEFYLNIPDILIDSATHKREEQLQRGTFYFHTKSRNPNWTPPIFNRHGVDITCGDKKRDIHGGILLRHLSGVGHRDGSGLALRCLVRGNKGFAPIKRGSPGQWSNIEIAFFKKMNAVSIFGHEMYLTYAPFPEKLKIKKKPRIGIENSNYAQENLGFSVE